MPSGIPITSAPDVQLAITQERDRARRVLRLSPAAYEAVRSGGQRTDVVASLAPWQATLAEQRKVDPVRLRVALGALPPATPAELGLAGMSADEFAFQRALRVILQIDKTEAQVARLLRLDEEQRFLRAAPPLQMQMTREVAAKQAEDTARRQADLVSSGGITRALNIASR